MRELGRMMVFAGAALAAIGALVWLGARRGGFPLRLGRLPGDIAVQGKHGSFYFPVVTCILLSVADADPVAGAMAEKVKQFELNLAPERKIWSVAELTARISGVLSTQFSNLWVEGEVSNYRPAQSGHLYFTLKDAKAQVKCVCFRTQAMRLKFRPEDGLKADRARIDQRVRAARRISDLRRAHRAFGSGSAAARVRAAQEAPRRRGLFDEARKKPLPMLPRRIGVVTSPRGAAVRDIIRILRRRFPNLHLIVYPVRVQGEGAAEEIAAALKYFNRKQSVDVILLARGGGSIEDLWAFNEEAVARAISACTIPVVSGVGHETDFTIADFVADVRASTPSAAAEIVVQSRQEFQRHLGELEHKISQRMRYVLLEYRHHLKELTTHMGFPPPRGFAAAPPAADGRTDRAARRRFARPPRAAAPPLHDCRDAHRVVRFARAHPHARFALVQRSTELGVRMERFLVGKIQQLETLHVQLDERSPLRVLQRGYAICTDAAGNVVSAADQVSIGAEVKCNSRAAASARKSAPAKFPSHNPPPVFSKPFSVPSVFSVLNAFRNLTQRAQRKDERIIYLRERSISRIAS
jgi:exodeoxyribonuclease VII large subunit